MNWEALAAPPAEPSAAFKRRCKHVYSAEDRDTHAAWTPLFDWSDADYFDSIGYRHNPLDRRVTA